MWSYSILHELSLIINDPRDWSGRKKKSLKSLLKWKKFNLKTIEKAVKIAE
jgi:hypothetical protein